MKSQAWSIELLLTVGVFMVLLVGSIAFLYSSNRTNPQTLVALNEPILERLFVSVKGDNPIGFLFNNVVDRPKLSQVVLLDYEYFRAQMGVTGDVCFFFVDKDGNYVYLNESGKRSYGSPQINISGLACGN
jgi:hypothetical protein